MILGERKQWILAGVVRDYVDTVRPIGSEDLATRHSSWGVKSATIRNELAELSEMGFLRQPHTSAGRIPSDLGYRFYVDHVMQDASAQTTAADYVDAWQSAFELERVLRHTCVLLTRMTSYTALATTPRPSDTRVTQIYVSAAGSERLLVVVLLSSGHAENRILATPVMPTPGDIAAIAEFVNAAYAGRSLESVEEASSSLDLPAPPELLRNCKSIISLILNTVRQIIVTHVSDDEVVMEGATEILKQPEFRDAAKIEGVLETLQKGTLVFQTSKGSSGSRVASVVIGAENHLSALRECSLVSAPYFVGPRERGSIGVVGPTRMNYDRAVSTVSFFARTLSQTLTHFACH